MEQYRRRIKLKKQTLNKLLRIEQSADQNRGEGMSAIVSMI